jgi:hypothetical protein
MAAPLIIYDFNDTVSPKAASYGGSGSEASNASLDEFWGMDSYGLAICCPANGATSAADAVSKNSYFSFKYTPPASNPYDLHSLRFRVNRGNGWANAGYVVRWSVDNYASNLKTADVSTSDPDWTDVSVDISAAEPDEEITFRIYTYGPSTDVQIAYENVALIGTPPGAEPDDFRLVEYDFDSGNANPSYTHGSVNATAISQNDLYMQYDSDTMGVGDEAGAVAHDSWKTGSAWYLSFKLTAKSGEKLYLSRLTALAAWYFSTTTLWALYTSVDSYASPIAYSPAASQYGKTWDTVAFDLSAPTLQGLDEITFRLPIYWPLGYDSSRLIVFDDLAVRGTSEVLPRLLRTHYIPRLGV